MLLLCASELITVGITGMENLFSFNDIFRYKHSVLESQQFIFRPPPIKKKTINKDIIPHHLAPVTLC